MRLSTTALLRGHRVSDGRRPLVGGLFNFNDVGSATGTDKFAKLGKRDPGITVSVYTAHDGQKLAFGRVVTSGTQESTQVVHVDAPVVVPVD